MKNIKKDHADIGLIISTLRRRGWDVIGGYDRAKALGIIAADLRIWGYAELLTTGSTQMQDLPQEPEALWELTREAIRILNDGCRGLGLPRFLPRSRKRATARILELYPTRSRGMPVEPAPWA